jgi:pimeloyl-ACP methyl ester carboxylesterase
MITIQDETFDGTYPFTPHYHDMPGFAMHFVDEGQGEPVVMLHGDPTWGYVYRHFMPPLATRYRCIVPDLMGMGKSGVPQEPYPYRLQQHIVHPETLLLGLDIAAVTLVLHDWGGPVGLGFAIRHPARVKRLVLLNTWAFAPWPGSPLPRLLTLIRSDRGERFVLEKHGYLESALLDTTHYPERLTPTVLRAYHAPFPTPASCLALLCWSRDIPMSEADPSYAEMKRIEHGLAQFKHLPILLIWGLQDPALPPLVLRLWQCLYPHAQTYAIADASHFVQEDAPERVVPCIERFLERG